MTQLYRPHISVVVKAQVRHPGQISWINVLLWIPLPVAWICFLAWIIWRVAHA
ncbi:MAG: hypothetical protein ABFD89_18570 [Bryobacteraceae bacterium]